MKLQMILISIFLTYSASALASNWWMSDALNTTGCRPSSTTMEEFTSELTNEGQKFSFAEGTEQYGFYLITFVKDGSVGSGVFAKSLSKCQFGLTSTRLNLTIASLIEHKSQPSEDEKKCIEKSKSKKSDDTLIIKAMLLCRYNQVYPENMSMSVLSQFLEKPSPAKNTFTKLVKALKK